MKSFQFKSLLLLTTLIISLPSFGQGLKAFKLKNGLSVYIWEDESKSDVFGLVGVRAGSINDPEEYTGLAHYLEHVMFKGTDKIGALNWTEEEPIYKEIIAKYDQMAEEADPAKKEAISKEINELTVKAGKLGLPNEYSNLMESMGAKTDGRHQPRLQLRGKGVLHRNTPLRPSIRYPEQEPPIGGQRTPVQLPTGKGHDAGDRKHRLLPA